MLRRGLQTGWTQVRGPVSVLQSNYVSQRPLLLVRQRGLRSRHSRHEDMIDTRSAAKIVPLSIPVHSILKTHPRQLFEVISCQMHGPSIVEEGTWQN